MKAALALAAVFAAIPAAPTQLPLPGGDGGIGFDDLRFSSEQHRVLVPAGRTGRLDLVDPRTDAIESIAGFSSAISRRGGHGQGTTSADAGRGYVFATDRTRRLVVAVDAGAKRIVAQADLACGPDYVRWVASGQEVWVTEPGRESIEVFRFEAGPAPRFTRTGSISVPGGPESLIVDPAGHRAYTNTFRDATLAIDVDSHAVASHWNNGCRGARGIELDPSREIVFVGCDEGKAVALDAAHGGTVLGQARSGDGVDVIAYSSTLSHLYVPGADSQDLTVVAVSGRGQLQALGSIPTAPEAHCATADDQGKVYVCDPEKGRLLVLHDPYPASR